MRICGFTKEEGNIMPKDRGHRTELLPDGEKAIWPAAEALPAILLFQKDCFVPFMALPAACQAACAYARRFFTAIASPQRPPSERTPITAHSTGCAVSPVVGMTAFSTTLSVAASLVALPAMFVAITRYR